MPISSSQLADDVVSVFTRSVTLTDAQIKALPTTPFEIVPAQVGKILKFVSALLIWDCRAGAYTNIDGDLSMRLRYSSGNSVSDVVVGGLVETSDKEVVDVTAIAGGAQHPLAAVENRAIQYFVSQFANGNFTGGNPANSLKIIALYTIIDV